MSQAVADVFTELSAAERAAALLDRGSYRQLLGPFERVESPHLPGQDIVPQSDDGSVVARGTIDGQPAVALSLDGKFQGGGIGEVNGAKLAGSLELALRDARRDVPIRPLLLLETGGIRLQEANLGLLAVAEIHAALVALRRCTPVVGVISGPVGCFGGMGIAAGLCGTLLMTSGGRLGLNGPEVIEQEAGPDELDSTDRSLVFRTVGGRQRVETGLADRLVADDTAQLAGAVRAAFAAGPPQNERSSSAASGLARLGAGGTWPDEGGRRDDARHGQVPRRDAGARAAMWFRILAGEPESGYPASVLTTTASLGGETVRMIAVTADPESPFPRARSGQVGLEQGWQIARIVRSVVEADQASGRPMPIVSIVDVPGQAHGYQEESLGIHRALAAAVDASATARDAGHPVVTFLAGSAISGGFLAHGAQANRIVSLNDEGVSVQVMSRASTARITRRTVDELNEIAGRFPATAYDGASFAKLGAVHQVLSGIDGDDPGQYDADQVRAALENGIADARRGTADLSPRLSSQEAREQREMSLLVRRRLAEEWDL